jgi:hypothetical protein
MVTIGQRLIREHLEHLPHDPLSQQFVHHASQISGPFSSLSDLTNAANTSAAILDQYQHDNFLQNHYKKVQDNREQYQPQQQQKPKKTKAEGLSDSDYIAQLQPAIRKAILEKPLPLKKWFRKRKRLGTAPASPVDTALPLTSEPTIKPAVEETPVPLVQRTPTEQRSATRKFNTKINKQNKLRYSRPTQSSFVDALHRLGSSDQAALLKITQQIHQSLGLSPSKSVGAIADSSHGSINGVAQTIEHGGDPAKATVCAAWYGHLSNAPAVGVFHVTDDGPDSVFKAKVSGSGDEVRATLDHFGIKHRVLIPKDHGFDVLMLDKGDKLHENIGQFAATHGSGLWHAKGHLELLGSNEGLLSGPNARKSYRNVISQYESGQM